MYTRSVAEQHTPIELLNPAADAAGRTGKWVHASQAAKFAVVCHITQGNAATILLSILQAQDNTGTGSKAGPATPAVYANLNTAASDALVAEASQSTFTTDAGVENKIVIFEFEATMLDLANGFNHFTISTGASNAANITQAEVIPIGMRYPGLTPPTQVD